MLERIKNNYKTLMIIAGINALVFFVVNLIFDIKYEQVDDFIIYNLYSGLDGTYNIHGVYLHPILCFILGLFFKVLPMVNWHTVFLLAMQFICFTIIGTLVIKRNNSKLSYILYILFVSVCYTSLLQLIQYTSVSALLILTAFFVLMDYIDRNKQGKKYIICYLILYALGIMTRMQSLLIIAPFFALYFVYNLILFIRKKVNKEKLVKIIKNYLLLGIITILVYTSNYIFYNNDVYKNYNQYNKLRTILQDNTYVSYDKNKEIFDEIGWSENDHYLFYTFNFGDENVYSKENLEKIVEYKANQGDLYNYEFDLENIINDLIDQMRNTNPYISIMFLGAFLVAIYSNKEKRGYIIAIFLVTLAVNCIFIVINRSMQRVVIPEYILGTAMFLYLTKYKEKIDKEKENIVKAISVFIIVITVIFAGGVYEFNYKLEDYSNYKDVIEYTNSHKENVYLYTVPSLQFRYLTYSVYEMPPKGAFSNLRVMGGWDMYTQNYYDFKERYGLGGTFLDLLKENVYLIDGDVTWSGNYYEDYKKHIILFIKEHYNIDVTCEKIETFDNIYIYKLHEIAE